MRKTMEAVVDEQGNIRVRQPVDLPPGSRVLSTVFGLEATPAAAPKCLFIRRLHHLFAIGGR